MVRRLVALIIGSAVLAAALALFCRLVFPDVSPYMPGEDVALGWRREAAFLTTTLAWLSAEVSVVMSAGLIAYFWKNRAGKLRSSRGRSIPVRHRDAPESGATSPRGR
jgi:hypothetical protein